VLGHPVTPGVGILVLSGQYGDYQFFRALPDPGEALDEHRVALAGFVAEAVNARAIA
jgi:hypothetical protein